MMANIAGRELMDGVDVGVEKIVGYGWVWRWCGYGFGGMDVALFGSAYRQRLARRVRGDLIPILVSRWR